MAKADIFKILRANDNVSVDEANIIANNLDAIEVNNYLLDVIKYGSVQESKLAAIVRGIIIGKEQKNH